MSVFLGGGLDGNGLFRHTITVQRKVATKDSSGGQVEGFVDVSGLTSLSCLIQDRRGHAPRALGQRQVLTTHAVYLGPGYDIRRGDRLYDPDTAAYFIVSNINDQGGQGRLTRIDCFEET